MVVSVSMYPNIQIAFSENANLEKMVNSEYAQNPRFFEVLENLFKDLINGNCKGVIEVMKDADSIHKMLSTIAELHIGRLFLSNGFFVTFLPDNYSPKSSPDIAVEKDGIRILVEVMKVGDGPVLDNLLTDLVAFLVERPFRVDIKLDAYMTLPPVGNDEVKKIKSDVEASLTELKSIFPSAPGSYTLQTKHITYEAYSISGQDGFPGTIRGTGGGVPTQKIIDHIGFYMVKKAKKRDDFDSADKTCPYIIAFVSEIPYLAGILFQEELYGRVTGYPDGDLKKNGLRTTIRIR